ncbi:hypothetical protein ABEF95_009375 [Exophiala dermatitidis]
MAVGKDPGFFYLTGHEIPHTLTTNIFEISKDFFTNCPSEDRIRFSSKSGEPGFSGPGKEKLSGLGHGDLKESYHFQSFKLSPNVALPASLAKHRATLQNFSDECERVGNVLLEAFSVGLKRPPTFLTKHHTGEQNRFRLLHYPPYLGSDSGRNPPDIEQSIRAGAHSDYGSITLLFQEPSDEGGLQVWLNGAWVGVPYVENAIVVNIGDALEFWTAGQLRSTIHRVTFPPGKGEMQSRYSIPFFVTADDNTLLEPILSPSDDVIPMDTAKAFFGDIARVKGYLQLDPITALEHRMRREATISGTSLMAFPQN